MTDRHDRAATLADQIQAELVRRGRWSVQPIDPARLVDMGAFGTRTLAAEEWIQHVLVPRVRELVASRGAFPGTSEVAVWATREFDGDPDADTLLGLLRALDELIEAPDQAPDRGSDDPAAWFEAAARGDAAAVTRMLDRGIDPRQRGPHGMTALHVAAAGGHPQLARLLASPFELDVATVGDARPPDGCAGLVPLLLARGADADARAEPSGLTPLMVATYFGHGAAIDLLRAHGADASARDAWGRTAERLAVFPTVARVIALCRRLPMVVSAHVAQIHAPVTHQYTTPVLGLALAAPLPGDAFAGWPAELPIVVVVLADDAVSRLVQLAPAVYTRPAAREPHPPAVTIDQLAIGKRYRVRATVQELPQGAIVRFEGFNDLDNHYGAYEFSGADGKVLRVGGDFSTLRDSPLADVDRYLELLPDDER